jgi:hypothetical protein
VERELTSIVDALPRIRRESVTRHVLEYLSTTLEELKGWTVGMTVHPHDSPSMSAAWKRSVATGEPYDIEHRIRRADGVPAPSHRQPGRAWRTSQ